MAYKIKEVKFHEQGENAYLMEGKIEHPKDVQIELERIENIEKEKKIVVVYKAHYDSSTTTEYEMHQELKSNAEITSVLVKVANPEGKEEDEELYILR